jgi:uncharacterized protein YyaL (SSP411 family)
MPWLDWNDEAFALARERHAPVLLFVKASWCRWCRELEDEVLAAPEVAALLERDFVTIRVDKDRRPDIDPRYTRGGWPTLAWLDEQGEVLGADNFLEREPLLERLRAVAAAHREGPERVRALFERPSSPAPVEPAEPAPRASRAALGTRPVELTLDIVERVTRSVLETADPVHGGWGKQHKFPHPEAIDFALVRWSQTGDAALLDLVRRTLRRMQEGEIHDRVEGGFYRFATRPDWSVPNTEKMLDSNAQRAFVYLEGYQATGEESLRATALGALRWMRDRLLDPATGAFRGSQDADEEYARLGTREARARRGAPPVDPTVFTNWNAIAVSTLLKAGAVLEDAAWSEQALETLEFLVREMWDPELGMHHYRDDQPHLPGMLGDQAYTLRALVDAAQFTGENRFLEVAERLASLSLERLRSDDGAFYDKPHDPTARGVLRHRNRSILENSVMAEALLRLALLSGNRDYEDCARETLASFTGDYRRYGHFVAGYARAVDLLFHEPVVVTVVGPRDGEATRALARAALRPYVASRIVRVVDPRLDPVLLERSGLPAPASGARAYVERGRESYADTDDPARLPGLMTRT